ncbi:ABC transporter permease [Rhizobium sp. B21/90]|uniref:ABC transporter permease n=1 Tax=Rhizobium sp. B21/90 TaxID=2819993 RepID=UPI001C5BA2EC|nr:ABC transporter permease subunit [Rhizobium sp. B21/90]QYA05287.1 ABC transporter permease subunit [Rhizobium sp. B21/90]
MSSWQLIGFGPNGWGALLLTASFMTLAVTITAVLMGALLGAAIAAAKLSGNTALVALGKGYTIIFQGVPELLIIYLIYFGGSSAVSYVAKLFGYDGFVSIPSFLSGTVAVGLICGAYQAEIFRAAYLALSKGELEAATAIGMSGALRFRRIIVPQVLRLAIPALSNVWQLSLKDSALISVTGLAELLRMSQIAAGSTRQYFTFFIAGGAIYLLLTAFSDNIFARAEKRANRSMQPSRLTDA